MFKDDEWARGAAHLIWLGFVADAASWQRNTMYLKGDFGCKSLEYAI